MKFWLLEVSCTILLSYFFIKGSAQDCDDGSEAELSCPSQNFLLRGLGSWGSNAGYDQKKKVRVISNLYFPTVTYGKCVVEKNARMDTPLSIQLIGNGGPGGPDVSAELFDRMCTPRSPFFGDALAVTCTNTNEMLYEEDESMYSFFSNFGGLTLDAKCPGENEIITKISLCIVDAHVPAATITCSNLKDPAMVAERYEATSDEMRNSRVDCGENGAVQSLKLDDAGDGVTTRVTFGCLMLSLPEEEIPE